MPPLGERVCAANDDMETTPLTTPVAAHVNSLWLANDIQIPRAVYGPGSTIRIESVRVGRVDYAGHVPDMQGPGPIGSITRHRAGGAY